MKQLLIALALVLSTAMSADAEPSAKNRELLKSLTEAMKSSASNQVVKTDNFRKTSFLFNGKAVSAFYDAEGNELIGFSIPMSMIDLSQELLQKIKTRFDKYLLQEAIMFVRRNGTTEFYVSLSRTNKPTIILSVSNDNKVHYFGKQ